MLRRNLLGAIWLLYLSVVLCTAGCHSSKQIIRFQEPRGAVAKINDLGTKNVPFTAEINGRVQYDVYLSFSEEALKNLGFTDKEITQLKELGEFEFKGTMRSPWQSKIQAIVSVSLEQVKAVLLEGKSIYWVYKDNNGTVILDFKGFPLSPAEKARMKQHEEQERQQELDRIRRAKEEEEQRKQLAAQKLRQEQERKQQAEQAAEQKRLFDAQQRRQEKERQQQAAKVAENERKAELATTKKGTDSEKSKLPGSPSAPKEAKVEKEAFPLPACKPGTKKIGRTPPKGYWQYCVSVKDKSTKQGPYHSFFQNGQLSSKGNYVDGKRHGHWVLYHSNGQKRLSAHYKSGEPTGTWEFWSKNGKKEKEEKH